ncbi:MAG: hypothetical protein ACLQFI_06815 [Methylocella sp.]
MTIYNSWNRWSRRQLWQHLFEALNQVATDADFQSIDSTTAKAHHPAAGGKRGQKPRQSTVPATAKR